MKVPSVRRLRSLTSITIASAVGLFAPAAAGQSARNACECMVAVCQSMQPGAQNASRCESLRGAPPAVCQRQLAPMLQMLERQHRTPPPVCTGTAPPPTPGGGGGSTPTASSPSNTTTSPTAPGPSPSESQDSTAPQPAAPDPVDPARSPSGRLGCVIHRDGHRVMFAGQSQLFEVRCVGIPLPGNPLGAGEPTAPPTRAADGRSVEINWSTPPIGILSPLHSHASYAAPNTVSSQPEFRIRATVTLVGPHGERTETLSVYSTVHVVSRHLHLDMATQQETRCNPGGQASMTVGFDLSCRLGIDLTVADDFSVSGTHGTACGTGEATNVQPCIPQAQPTFDVPFTFDSASGRIDPESGVMTLSLTGNRADYPSVRFTTGQMNHARPDPLFPMPLTIWPDEGATRSMGSLHSNRVTGVANQFTVHSR